jgi:protein-disulfide isomerase
VVDADLADAKRLGMASTPSFVIDGIRQAGMIPFGRLKLLIDAELTKKRVTASRA